MSRVRGKLELWVGNMSEVELSRKWDQCLLDVVDRYWFWIRDCFLTFFKRRMWPLVLAWD